MYFSSSWVVEFLGASFKISQSQISIVISFKCQTSASNPGLIEMEINTFLLLIIKWYLLPKLLSK